MLALFGALLFCLPAPSATDGDYQSARRKMTSIETMKVKRGGRVQFSEAELNAFLRTELHNVTPPGVRNPSSRLIGGNKASGGILIDFLKLQAARGQKPSWLLKQLLSGEREVEAQVRVQSGAGSASVFLERVSVGGIPLEGPALDFLIDNYFSPRYPDAKIGKPFALKYNIERIDITPGAAHVIMKP